MKVFYSIFRIVCQQLVVASFLAFAFASQTFAQCNVTANATSTEIICGDCVNLSHFGTSAGNISFSENFDSGVPTGWSFTQQASFNNPCSANGVDGTPHIWMGAQSSVPRALETLPLDFSSSVAPAGGTICFDMLFAEQGNDSPCEGPDEPNEGVYLQYSADGGATWITIEYFDPNGGNDPQLVNWNNWCFPIPAGALINGVQFRWFQDADSGAEYDHWGIDNVEIIVNDPNIEFVWQHDNYTTSLPGDNPTQVCPTVTTDYTVEMTTPTGAICQATVQIVVTNPEVIVDAGSDQQVCAGDCIDLAGDATVIVSPASTPTFENNETSTITGLPSQNDLANLLLPCLDFGGCNCPDGSTVALGESCPTIFNADLAMNINVTDLNTTSLQPGELVSICIESIDMQAGDLSPFGITLTCPSGSEIILANAGDLAGTTLTNACFSLGGTSQISTGNGPYTGDWQPIEPFTNLNGCDANGVWTLTFTGTFDLSGGTLPIGFLTGWSISFDDPEISYVPDVLWSPTTDMAAGEENTLTPEVCPTGAITYTLTASDNAGCVTVSDDVSITIDPVCCDPQTPPIQGPTPLCENATGNVYSVTNTVGSTYTWTVPAGATITAGQGTNSITVDFGTTSGDVSVVETIGCGDGPAETFAVTVEVCAGCVMNSLDVVMTSCYTSGQGLLQYDIEGTLTFTNPPATGQLIVSDCFLNQQTFNPPFTSPFVFTYSGLPQDGQDCDFGAVFTDDQNCNITTTFTAPPTITSFTANCIIGTGEVDGTIEFNNPPATGTIVISIDDGTNTQTTNIQPPFNSPETWQVTGLNPAAANYVITYYFSDFASCSQTLNIICGCAAAGGTTTTTTTGDGTTDFILCEGDQVSINTNNDYSFPDDDGVIGGFAYQPAYVYLVYTCPPTPGVFPGNDPCFVGVIPIEDNVSDINDATSLISQFPPGFFADNEVFLAPITLYHYDPVAGNYIVNASCWAMGPTSAVTYLPPVTSVVTPDCQTNTVSVVVSGGYPEIYGGDFTGSNLLPTTASFATSTAGNNGTIVIDGLQNGDNYSFDITDENGCPITITGGPFVALPTPAAGTDAQTCILSYNLEGLASFGTGVWTGGPAGTTFSPDANTANATVTVPSAGAYTFTWTEDNGNGCVSSDDVEITFSLMSIPAVITNAACGATDGEIVVAPQGGVAPYTYSWTSGGNSALESNLGAGSTTVTVTDDTGCSLDSTFIISQPVTFNYVLNSSDETCFAACDGTIDIQPDGAGPYTYGWTPNVSNSNTESNLCQDDYEILVADADGCTQVINVTIGGPTQVVTTLSSDLAEICIGSTAILSSTIAGGTAPYTYFWIADPADLTLVATDANPTVSPVVTTSYTLIVTDANGCPSAPKTITITVLPALSLDVVRPLVSPDTSICPYDFATIDLIAGGGDGNYQIYLLPDITNPITLPLDTQPVVTTTFDFMVTDGCTTPAAFASSAVTVFELPSIIIDAAPDSGCHPLTVSFTDLTQPSPQGWEWNFGDPDENSNTSNISDPTHLYSGPGLYDVSLSITTADGCETDTTLSNYIEVFPLPYANFTLDPEVINLLNADIFFTDLSTPQIDSWDWDFGDGESSTTQNPNHIYGDTGTFIISLVVTTINGCTNETQRQLIVEPDFMFYVPNAFTPNENGRNDNFRGYGEGINWDTYQMSIFDRWGEIIYYTENIDEPWDGTYKGKQVELNVYVWKIRFYDVKGNDHDYYGHVTLLR